LASRNRLSLSRSSWRGTLASRRANDLNLPIGVSWLGATSDTPSPALAANVLHFAKSVKELFPVNEVGRTQKQSTEYRPEMHADEAGANRLSQRVMSMAEEPDPPLTRWAIGVTGAARRAQVPARAGDRASGDNQTRGICGKS
jgi:hypothetical protein